MITGNIYILRMNFDSYIIVFENLYLEKECIECII